MRWKRRLTSSVPRPESSACSRCPCSCFRKVMTLILGAAAVITLYLLLQMFRAANPAVLARTIKFGGGVVALAVAAFTGLRGELAVAIPLGIFGAGLLGWTPLANAGFGNIGG